MNRRLIILLLFFFALFTPLVFNAPSFVYHALAVNPTPFGAGPVIPPGGNAGGGSGGTTVPMQTAGPGKAFNGWNGTSFDTVTMPTPGPTASPIPASTPIAGQAVTGWDSNMGSPTRQSFQAPLPTATPTAGKAMSSWNGTSFDTVDIQAPLPTATPTPEEFVTDWDGNVFHHKRPVTTDIADFGTYVDAISQEGAPSAGQCTSAKQIINDVTDSDNAHPYICGGSGASANPIGYDTDGLVNLSDNHGHTIHVLYDQTDPLVPNSMQVVDKAYLLFTCSDTTKVCTMDIDWNAATEDSTPTLTNYFVLAQDKNSPYNVRKIELDKIGGGALAYHNCKQIEQLKATDDNMMFDRAPVAGVTITRVSCLCKGTCSGTLATFTLHAGGTGGTAMAITDTNPVCGVQGGSAGTAKAVTANNVFTDSQDFSFDVTNTPTNNAVDTYELCLDGTSP